MKKVFYTLAVLAYLSGPAAAQEKEFTFDRTTGAVTAKDVEQDKAIAALQKEVADLKAKLAAPRATAPGVAVAAPFAATPCESGACPFTPGTTVPTVVGVNSYRPAPARYEEVTYTGAPPATYGITNGCAGGACAVQTGRVGWYLGKRLGR